MRKSIAILTGLIYYLFYGFCIGIFLNRGAYEIWSHYPFVQTFVDNNHITNFVLSALLVLCLAIFPVARKQFRLAGLSVAGVIVLNIIVESGNGLANVADPLDVLSGVVGTTVATFILMALVWARCFHSNQVPSKRETILTMGLAGSYLAICLGLFLYRDALALIPLQYVLDASLSGVLGITAASYFAAKEQFRSAQLAALSGFINVRLLDPLGMSPSAYNQHTV